jgi:DNA-binding NarL/FixJ family response regulator
MKPLSILIADDHAVVRRGLRALLETQPGWMVCAEAGNGNEAVAEAQRLRPDIAILDIGMPELNGLQATARIRKAVPHTRVLILTMHNDVDLVEATVKAGAQGYLLKSDAEVDLIAAVDALRQNRTFFTPTASEVVLQGFRGEQRGAGGATSGSREDVLTNREQEIMQLLAEGRSNKETATKLGISTRTVENHRASIKKKLRCRSMADLIRGAIRKKIVEL